MRSIESPVVRALDAILNYKDTMTFATPLPPTGTITGGVQAAVVTKVVKPKSARKQQADIVNRISDLKAEITALENKYLDLQAAADAEPEEFDGSKVVVGANVIVAVGNGENRKELAGVVKAKKDAGEGAGKGLMFRIETGDGFDAELRTVYPGQILRYADVKTA